MQLDHLEVLGAEPGLIVNPLRRLHIHVVADDVAGTAVEGGREVGGHRLPDDLHGLPGKVVLGHVILTGQHDRGRPVGGGRALQFGQRVGDHLRGQDVVEGVLLLELRVRVVDRVLVVLETDLREMLRGGAVFLHVLAAGRAEHPRRHRKTELVDFGQGLDVLAHRRFPVVGAALQRSGLHLLEAQRQHAVGQPAADGLRTQVQRGGPRGAVVVDVDDRDARHPEFVECALPRRRIAGDVPDVALLDLGVVDPGVLERFGAGLLGHLRVVPALAAARLLELRHADADDVNLVGSLAGHQRTFFKRRSI